MHIGFFDGSSNPNPGELGLGICVYANGKEILCGAKPSGHGTNNEAEYRALIWLLEECLNQDILNITCYGDSQLVVRQVMGQWNAGKKELIQLLERVNELRNKFETFDLIWIRREKNSRADALSKRGVVLKEAKLSLKNPVGDESDSVVCISEHAKKRSIVLPMMKDELVIVEHNHSIYLNTKNCSCSCSVFTKSRRCKHIDAFHRVLQKRAV